MEWVELGAETSQSLEWHRMGAEDGEGLERECMGRQSLALFFAALLFLTVACIGTALAPLASAQTTTPARRLSISPLRAEVFAQEGTAQSGSLTLYNTGSESLNIQMNTQLFTVTDNDYNYVFKENSPLNQWIHYDPANFTMAANSSQVVNYTIVIPNTADPGDKYFSLFASTAPAPSSSPITTTERVASIVYLTVPGDISKTGSLLNLRSPILTTSNTTWSASIQDTGNAHFRSHYTVDIQTLWGQSLVRQDDSALILANSIRLVSNDLTMPRWLGIYKVDYSIELGDTPTAHETRLLFYLPLTQVFPLLAFLAVLIFIVIQSHRMSRRKKHEAKKKTNSSAE